MMTDLFLVVLGTSLSVGFMVIVLLLLTPLLNKRYAVKWKYLIWIFLALRLLIPFSGTDWQPVPDTLPQTKTSDGAEPEGKYGAAPVNTDMAARRIMVEIPAQMTVPIEMYPAWHSAAHSERQDIMHFSDITMLDIAALAWIAGSLIIIFVHLASYFYCKRQVMRRGKMIRDAGILRQMFALKQELHIRRSILVIEYSEAGSPMVIGFLKPVLVLPQERYSGEELFFILKHELVHLKRGDVYFKLLFAAAGAVHWFNPLVWILQKEAAVDMELSCDERVTQGACYEVRKAYTETLMSMLHKRYAGRTLLSTQFYGGKKIMKKRFKNILLRNTKKNGLFIVFCIAILTMGSGVLVGCSVAKEDTAKANTVKVNTGTDAEGKDAEIKDAEGKDAEIKDAEGKDAETKDAEGKDTETKDVEGRDDSEKNSTVLIFIQEGEEVQKQATLAVGDGYSLFFPDDDDWRLCGPDLWMTSINEKVALWVTDFEGRSRESVGSDLADDGYVEEEDNIIRKREGNVISNVILKESGNDVWGIFYSYPDEPEYEEGWGRVLPVIADSFAVSAGADQKGTGGSDDMSGYPELEPANGKGADGGSDDMNGYGIQGLTLGDGDCEEMEKTANEFAEAFFDGRADAVRKFLAGTYEEEIEIYESTGTISDLKVKGLSDAAGKEIENGKYTVSVEFRDSSYEDMLLYLTLIFVKEEGGWKIQFYGVEG